MGPDKIQERKEQQEKVAAKFATIKAPIEARKKELMKKKETFQFKRDMEDEISWADEKMAQASSQELGNTLGEVSLLLKKVQMMQAEIANHEPRISSVMETGQKMIDEGHPEADKFDRDLGLLTEKWERLSEMLEARKQKLLINERVQQFLFDANEAESWMSEQELYMMVEDRGKDEFSAQNLMKKHGTLESTVDDYAETIRQLGETARQLIADEHPKKEDNFGDLYSLGKELLSMSHYASNEIKEKLRELTDKRNGMIHRWEERWEHLPLILEVYQFARDAAVAEAWLIAQDPYLKSEEFGQSIDEVENLIKKHEAFEKAAAAQEERFAALERLTTFELKDMKRRQEEEEDRRRQEEESLKQAPPPVDKTDGEKSETQSLKSKATDEELEGMLVRKHEWESTTKKASNRSWDRVCVVLKGQNIFFYKDNKSYKMAPDQTFRGESPVELEGANANVADDYTKKKHVFRLRLANGGDYLFQAHDDDEMTQWVNCINQVALDDAGPSSKSQTLPSGEKKDEPKRRSFFTLKKN